MLPTAPIQADGAPIDAAAFAAGLLAERDALVSFIELLRAEQEVLVQGDTERLAALAKDKADKIDLLTLLGEQRGRHFAAQKLPGSADGMSSWLRRNPGFAAAVSKIWQELLAHAETARQVNQINGALIKGGLHQTGLKLAVLQTAATLDNVYRSDGHLQPLRSARSLSQV